MLLLVLYWKILRLFLKNKVASSINSEPLYSNKTTTLGVFLYGLKLIKTVFLVTNRLQKNILVKLDSFIEGLKSTATPSIEVVHSTGFEPVTFGTANRIYTPFKVITIYLNIDVI